MNLEPDMHQAPVFRRYVRRCSVTKFSIAHAAFQAISSLHQEEAHHDVDHDDVNNVHIHHDSTETVELEHITYFNSVPPHRESPLANRRSLTEATLREAARLAGDEASDDENDGVETTLVDEVQVESLKPTMIPVFLADDVSFLRAPSAVRVQEADSATASSTTSSIPTDDETTLTTLGRSYSSVQTKRPRFTSTHSPGAKRRRIE